MKTKNLFKLVSMLGIVVGMAASITVFRVLLGIAVYGAVLMFEHNSVILAVEIVCSAIGSVVCCALLVKEVLEICRDFEGDEG